MYYSLAFICMVLYNVQSLHCQEQEEIQEHPVTCPRSTACKQVAELGLKPGPNPRPPEGPGAPAVSGAHQWECPLLALLAADSSYITCPLPRAQGFSLVTAGTLLQETCPGTGDRGALT